MDIDGARRLANEISRTFPMRGRSDDLILSLQDMGYYRARKFLIAEIPSLTVGHRFDERECAILNGVDHNSAFSLFQNMQKDNAKKMWLAFHEFRPEAAVFLLDSFADRDTKLLKSILVGKAGLTDADEGTIRSIFNQSYELDLTLPVAVLEIGGDVIFNAAVALKPKRIYSNFIHPFMMITDDGVEDVGYFNKVMRLIEMVDGHKASKLLKLIEKNWELGEDGSVSQKIVSGLKESVKKSQE